MMETGSFSNGQDPNQPLNFAGNVDNVGIFSSILSPQEIEDRYNLNYSPNAENILANNWKFNSGSVS